MNEVGVSVAAIVQLKNRKASENSSSLSLEAHAMPITSSTQLANSKYIGSE